MFLQKTVMLVEISVRCRCEVCRGSDRTPAIVSLSTSTSHSSKQVAKCPSDLN